MKAFPDPEPRVHSADDPVGRLVSAIVELAPAAQVLPVTESGFDLNVPLRVPAGADWAVEGLRVLLEQPGVVALGATFTRVWPPARVGDETWFVGVRRERAGLLADALAKRTLYPLVLVPQSVSELERVAPTVVEGKAEIEVHDVAERHRPPSAHFLRLVTAKQLELIDEALRADGERDARGPFPGLKERTSMGGGAAVLREAVRQARIHPVEVAA